MSLKTHIAQRTGLWFFLIVLPLYLFDQITKWWTVLHFNTPHSFVTQEGKQYQIWYNELGHSGITWIEGYLNWIRVHNQGVAFGLGHGSSWAPVVFLLIPFVALILIVVFWKKGVFTGISQYSAPLLIAGVLGNLTDRLVQGFYLQAFTHESFWTRLMSGYVVDFIDVTIPFIDYRWPTFNVADSCVCVAAGLLMLQSFRAEDAKPQKS